MGSGPCRKRNSAALTVEAWLRFRGLAARSQRGVTQCRPLWNLKFSRNAKSQPAAPASKEPELFAAEIEMERKSSNFLPLVFILGLVVVVGGAIFYFVKGARDVLTVPVATTAVNQILAGAGPIHRPLQHWHRGIEPEREADGSAL